MEKIYFGIGKVRIEVDDITSISSSALEMLDCGDEVIKITGNQKHHYRCSYKEHHKGLCLTYVDASCVETVSYDYSEGAWVYNSTDVAHLGE